MLAWNRWPNPTACALPFQQFITASVNLYPLCAYPSSLSLSFPLSPNWMMQRQITQITKEYWKKFFPHQQMFFIWTPQQNCSLHSEMGISWPIYSWSFTLHHSLVSVWKHALCQWKWLHKKRQLSDQKNRWNVSFVLHGQNREQAVLNNTFSWWRGHFQVS